MRTPTAQQMAFFTEEQISLAGVARDGYVLYAVELAGAPHQGQVRISACRWRAGETESWIAEELNRQIARFGLEIVSAALARPLQLD
jgi:hypothetical protein